jgi:hypothetical protein
VDRLSELSGAGIHLLRDQDEMHYKDSIRTFMDRIGSGKCVVVVLSKKYLESKNCMFELTEIAARKDIRIACSPCSLRRGHLRRAYSCTTSVLGREDRGTGSWHEAVSGANLQGIREGSICS